MRRLFAAMLLLLAMPAFAGNGMNGAPVVMVERQSASIAIKAIVGGDNDSTAVLRIFQRWQFAPSFDTGMVMIRRPHGSGGTAAASGEIFEGRIIVPPLPCGLPQTGRVVEWYIEATDAGGKVDYRSSAAPDTASLQPIRQLVATGPVYYVSQAVGDDNNAGTKQRPMRTINAALSALSASTGSGANGGIFVAPGEYHEQLQLDAAHFPTDGGFRFLEGNGPNRDSTIICGANQLVEQGLYAPGKPIRWTFTGQDSTWKAYFPGGSAGPADSMMLVVLGWGEYVERKTSIRAVLNDSTWTGDSFSTNGGELSGWFWQNDTLYLKRRSGRSPVGQKLHFGYLDALVSIQRRNWRIANLTIRFAGGSNGDPGYLADPRPVTTGNGVRLGTNVSGRSASGSVIDSCTFYGFNAPAIYGPHWAGGVVSDTVTIANCILSGPGMGYMDFGAGRGRMEEHASQISLMSRAISFVSNAIFDLHNGIEMGAGASDSTWGSQSEIAGNVLDHIVGDCIKLDGSHAINSLVSGNSISNGGSSGLSVNPIFSGPLFVLYNTFQNCLRAGIKCGGGTSGAMLCAHNTIFSEVPGSAAVDATAGGAVDGLSFMNNVLYSTNATPVIGPSGASILTNGFNFDWFGGVSTPNYFTWAGSDMPTKIQVQLGVGWEKNGLDAFTNGNIAVVDSTRRNLSLRASSPALNIGRRITGVNTWLNGARYSGSGPDIGSEERLIP